jgi:hypothetical protein
VILTKTSGRKDMSKRYSPVPQTPMHELNALAALIKPIGASFPELTINIENQMVSGRPAYRVVASYGRRSSLNDDTPNIFGNRQMGFGEISAIIPTRLEADLAAFHQEVVQRQGR